MKMKSIIDVLNESVGFCFSFPSAFDVCSSHAVGDHAHLAILPLFPHPVGDVKQNALEEEHERHPLVVRVVTLLAGVAP